MAVNERSENGSQQTDVSPRPESEVKKSEIKRGGRDVVVNQGSTGTELKVAVIDASGYEYGTK